MDAETAKAINNISKRLNSVEQKMESYLLERHEENKEAIATTDGGVVDIADVVSAHDEAIAELAGIISVMSEGE
ncbi:MAG: hypothetical protein NC419_13325 [Muribaculaceae bacterium]|nr:hypothetical protein [Muribaculaceae bacterium]